MGNKTLRSTNRSITEYLELSDIFQNNIRQIHSQYLDYRSGTSVNNLELIEKNKSFSAHLNLEFKIIDNLDNQIIISHKADRISILKQKDLNLFADEVSKMIREELKIFAGMIKDKRYLFSRDT